MAAPPDWFYRRVVDEVNDPAGSPSDPAMLLRLLRRRIDRS